MLEGISNINNIQVVSGKQELKKSEKNGAGVEGKGPGELTGDRVSLNLKEEAQPLTYGSSLTEEQQLDSKFLMLRSLVTKTLKDQGLALRVGIGEGKMGEISQITPEEAQALISDDGYWGVEKTSDRIVAFATGIAGNDPARLGEIKEEINRGFKMAMEAFGGYLPEISHKTYDAVMKKLDEWGKGLETRN